MLAECPGWSLGVGLSGLGPLGELPGGALGARPRRTRGGLGSIRGILPAGVLGDRCRVRRLPGQLSLAGLATHSGASGRLAAHSELPGTRGAFGGIRSKYHSRGSRRTRVLPGGLRRTRSLLVTRGAFGGFRVLSLAGLHGAFGDFRRGWRRRHSGHVAFSERIRRRFRRRLRRVHSVGLRDGSERIRDTRRAPKGSERGGASRWLSKGL